MITLLCILVLATLIILIFIGLRLVKMNEKIDKVFSFILDFQEDLIPQTIPSLESQSKTWDEKYEEDLDAYRKAIRSNSGLSDIPSPKSTWGEPPKENIKNLEGLTVIDK